ncbi:MAG TPA: hypothetical protein PLU22_25170 [Polyangiaceae bacterium]|mgnify:CR=1 FL=1|nr:hypothetical protein [Polyangiaceae bacterium]
MNSGVAGDPLEEAARHRRPGARAPAFASSPRVPTLGDAKRLPNGNPLVTYSNNGVIHEANTAGELVQRITTRSLGYTSRRQSLHGTPPSWAR